jgi:hypothetical protein
MTFSHLTLLFTLHLPLRRLPLPHHRHAPVLPPCHAHPARLDADRVRRRGEPKARQGGSASNSSAPSSAPSSHPHLPKLPRCRVELEEGAHHRRRDNGRAGSVDAGREGRTCRAGRRRRLLLVAVVVVPGVCLAAAAANDVDARHLAHALAARRHERNHHLAVLVRLERAAGGGQLVRGKAEEERERRVDPAVVGNADGGGRGGCRGAACRLVSAPPRARGAGGREPRPRGGDGREGGGAGGAEEEERRALVRRGQQRRRRRRR